MKKGIIKFRIRAVYEDGQGEYSLVIPITLGGTPK